MAPFSAAIAASAPSLISTNPKPRDRPVSRSLMICVPTTVPCLENSTRRSSSVVPNGRLPTYKFFAILLPRGDYRDPEKQRDTAVMAVGTRRDPPIPRTAQAPALTRPTGPTGDIWRVILGI